MNEVLLQGRIDELEAAIRAHRESWLNGDDKCWKDNEELYKKLPEGFEPPERDELVEIGLCRQYIASCHHPDVKYVSPQRRIEELERLEAEMRVIVEGGDLQQKVAECLGEDLWPRDTIFIRLMEEVGEVAKAFRKESVGHQLAEIGDVGFTLLALCCRGNAPLEILVLEAIKRWEAKKGGCKCVAGDDYVMDTSKCPLHNPSSSSDKLDEEVKRLSRLAVGEVFEMRDARPVEFFKPNPDERAGHYSNEDERQRMARLEGGE